MLTALQKPHGEVIEGGKTSTPSPLLRQLQEEVEQETAPRQAPPAHPATATRRIPRPAAYD